jgi:hypothetical protein
MGEYVLFRTEKEIKSVDPYRRAGSHLKLRTGRSESFHTRHVHSYTIGGCVGGHTLKPKIGEHRFVVPSCIGRPSIRSLLQSSVIEAAFQNRPALRSHAIPRMSLHSLL